MAQVLQRKGRDAGLPVMVGLIYKRNRLMQLPLHNASMRFTDGAQFGPGGELAITDKLHQKRSRGLQHLITNKWFVHGSGQAGEYSLRKG